MKRKFDYFLKDILECIEDIEEFTKDLTFEEFKNDRKTSKAVTKSFEIIGEAISNIPDEIKKKYPNVPWRNIKDFRNLIVHKYWSIDYEAEWEIIKTKIKPLKKDIMEIIRKELSIN